MSTDRRSASSIEKSSAARPFSEQTFDPMPSRGPEASPGSTTKIAALAPFRDAPRGAPLTTDQGLPIANTDDSLKAGVRGPSLLEDSHFREKIARLIADGFDGEAAAILRATLLGRGAVDEATATADRPGAPGLDSSAVSKHGVVTARSSSAGAAARASAFVAAVARHRHCSCSVDGIPA